MRKRIRLLIGGMIALGANAAQAAAPEDPNRYALQWVLEPQPVPAAPFWVKEQGEVAKTRLLPTKLYVVDDDVRSGDGTLLIPAAFQIVRLTTARETACTIAKASAGSRAARERVCVVDTNGDGAFDAYFTKGSGGYFWFSMTGKLPAAPKPVKPFRHHAVANTEMMRAPMLSLNYQRIMDSAVAQPLNRDTLGRIRFDFRVGSDKRRERMVRDCSSPALPSYCASAALPARFEFAGLAMNITQRRKEDILIAITSTFASRTVELIDLGGQYSMGELVVLP